VENKLEISMGYSNVEGPHAISAGFVNVFILMFVKRAGKGEGSAKSAVQDGGGGGDKNRGREADQQRNVRDFNGLYADIMLQLPRQIQGAPRLLRMRASHRE
jgi:hypothetical protein